MFGVYFCFSMEARRKVTPGERREEEGEKDQEVRKKESMGAGHLRPTTTCSARHETKGVNGQRLIILSFRVFVEVKAARQERK